jgi:hypothetical protein
MIFGRNVKLGGMNWRVSSIVMDDFGIGEGVFLGGRGD